jgi:hypothetical protein
MNKNFFLLTEKLLTINEELSLRFEETKSAGKEPDFYVEVVPYTNEVKKWNDEWLDIAIKWLDEKRPKHIHLNQITSTHDHLEQISVQAFFPSTSRKRFIDSNRAVEYVLKSILLEANNEVK